jgi:DNA/RNA-binding domain of Phe-tRNA-synthetase-like protein
VFLKEVKVITFKELYWKLKIQQRKEMLSMQAKIQRIKKAGHLLPVLPLIKKTDNLE